MMHDDSQNPDESAWQRPHVIARCRSLVMCFEPWTNKSQINLFAFHLVLRILVYNFVLPQRSAVDILTLNQGLTPSHAYAPHAPSRINDF